MSSDSEIPGAVSGALLASGFPFQTAVAALIRKAPDWSLVEQEFPWKDATGNDQFIDIVAARDSIFAVVECRKTQKETLTFLLPPRAGRTPLDVERILGAFTSQIRDSGRRVEVFWGDWDLDPSSAEAMFCVVSTSATGKDQRMLEKDAQKLIRATDAYAQERRRRFQPSATDAPDHIFLPILVTNAPLYTARYEPETVSLESGQFETLPDLKPAKAVRFRKTFTSEMGRDMGDRTVLVVSALALADLLGGLQVIDGPKGERGRPFPPR